MVQIIPENPSFASQMGRGLGRAGGSFLTQLGESYFQNQQQKQQAENQKREDEVISQLIGQDVSGIRDPAMRKLIVENTLKGQAESQKSFMQQMQQQQEKSVPLKAGLDTISRMRQLGSKDNLGRGTGFRALFGGETSRQKGEYEQLGKSLISLASNIPIRNQAEFETLSAKLFDASLPDAERDGILNAMERIIKGSLGEDYESVRNEERPAQKSKLQGETISLSSESAAKYKGKRIIDDSTGKVLRSNGNEWVPE